MSQKEVTTPRWSRVGHFECPSVGHLGFVCIAFPEPNDETDCRKQAFGSGGEVGGRSGGKWSDGTILIFF